MTLKKILATVAATAMAVTAMATSAFASTITIGGDYVGDWGQGATIEMAEFEAYADTGCSLTVKLSYEPSAEEEILGQEFYSFAPKLNIDGWPALYNETSQPGTISGLTSKTGLTDEQVNEYDATLQNDGFIVMNYVTRPETAVFNITAEGVKYILDNQAQLIFQVKGVTVETITIDAPIADAPATDAPSTDAPADGDSNVDTGVAPVAALAVVALAGAALVATKKR